jgi:hypothetical protein
MMTDGGAEVLEFAARSCIARPLGDIRAAEAAIDFGKHLIAEEGKQRPGALCRFLRPRML